MPLDFPSSPAVGATVTGIYGEVYTYDGEGWTLTADGGGTGGAQIVMGDTAPSSPLAGMLWWRSDVAKLCLWDGQQWIIVVNTPGGGVTEDRINELIANSINPQGGGRFEVFGTSVVSDLPSDTVRFRQFNGNFIKINGVFYPIPLGNGVVANRASTYVEGVAGQSLAAITLYYVYMFNNAGVLAMDFSVTSHATSAAPGNESVQVKQGDETRTLIGLVLTDAAGQFRDTLTQRYTDTWLNRPSRTFTHSGTFSGLFGTSMTNTGVQLDFAMFGGPIFLIMNGSVQNNTQGAVVYTRVRLNGGDYGQSSAAWMPAANASQAFAVSYGTIGLNGRHFAGLAAQVTTGAASGAVGIVGIIG